MTKRRSPRAGRPAADTDRRDHEAMSKRQSRKKAGPFPRPVAAHAKIKSLSAAVRAVRRAQAAGRRVVFTNGCFDLLHRGHTQYLEQARALGDLLIVALNSDGSVRALKGAGRPIVPAEERAAVLAALASVDLVITFEELDPARVIHAIEPDVLVKGGDWPVSQIVGADFVLSRGGRVHNVPYVGGRSTTALIARIRSLRKSPASS